MVVRIYTPEDLLTMPDGDRYELVNGQLVERNVSALSSFVGGRVYRRLGDYVEAAKLGWEFPDNASFQCFVDEPKKVRKVDAAFIAAHRMTSEDVRTQGHITIVPDIVLEVISPNDLAYDVNRKIEEWLDAGVKILWVIDPETKKVQVYRANGSVTRLSVADDLTADEVLPGFRCSIAGLFPPCEPR